MACLERNFFSAAGRRPAVAWLPIRDIYVFVHARWRTSWSGATRQLSLNLFITLIFFDFLGLMMIRLNNVKCCENFLKVFVTYFGLKFHISNVNHRSGQYFSTT